MSYVYAGYGITVLSLVGYALRVVTRERRLHKSPHRGDDAASAGAPTKR